MMVRIIRKAGLGSGSGQLFINRKKTLNKATFPRNYLGRLNKTKKNDCMN